MGRLFATTASVGLAYRDVLLGPEPDRITEIQKGEPTSFLEMVATGNIPIPQQSAMWRRNLFPSLGGLDPRWHVLLDRDFSLRAAERSPELPRWHWRLLPPAPRAKSTAEIELWERELPRYYREFFARRAVARRTCTRRGGEATARIYLTCSLIARRLGAPVRAAGWLLLAAAADPGLTGGRVVTKGRRLLSRSARE